MVNGLWTLTRLLNKDKNTNATVEGKNLFSVMLVEIKYFILSEDDKKSMEKMKLLISLLTPEI